MEIIGFGITVAAIVWGAIEVMKHFFPSWEQHQENAVRSWIHERLDDIEKDIMLLQMHYGNIVNPKKDDQQPEATKQPSAD
jgi:hypothetical protein